MNVGQRITELKLAKGLTTNKLAGMAGISQSALRSIELGEKSPTMETLSLILDALVIDHKAFFATDNQPDKNDHPPIFALSRSDDTDSDLPDEAVKQIEDFRAYIRQKYKKPD